VIDDQEQMTLPVFPSLFSSHWYQLRCSLFNWRYNFSHKCLIPSVSP